jgi:alpha-tubulin suppressor-like RCC1 family protein
MNLNTRLHILGHVALKLAALAGALGGLLLITTIMLPPRAAQASSPDLQAAVAAGSDHTCALKGGQVYCWGYNFHGQLGDGTYYTNRTTPTLVANGAMANIGVTAVAAGGWHNCAIKSGALYCWGRNDYGQLGDGTTTQRITPTLVADGEMGNSGVTAVAASFFHTCALKGGKVYCWGRNNYGQLGDGTTTDRITPTLVADGEMGNSGVTAVAAGEVHTCALKGGRVYCWGRNDYGQLGDGTTTDRITPTLVADGEMGNSGVTAVAAGRYHTCALKGGKVYCWGLNGSNQLGASSPPTCDGLSCSTTPLKVADGEMVNSGVTAVAAGNNHTCALKGGKVYCWGWNYFGQLGDGTATDFRATPTLVANGEMGNSGVSAVAAGGYHTLGLKDTTCLFAWGRNAQGQLGDGTTTSSNTPVQVSGGCGWGITLPVFIPIVYRP